MRDDFFVLLLSFCLIQIYSILHICNLDIYFIRFSTFTQFYFLIFINSYFLTFIHKQIFIISFSKSARYFALLFQSMNISKLIWLLNYFLFFLLQQLIRQISKLLFKYFLMSLSIFIVLYTLVFCVLANTSTVDYSLQSQWAGTCQTGTQQSPIDINTKTLGFCPNYKLKIKFQCLAIPFNTGTGQSYTISSFNSSFVGINDLAVATPNVRLYKSAQYHFHAPSQHTINGIQYALQIHHFHTPIDNANGTNSAYTSQFIDFDTSSYNNQTLFASVVSYLFYPSNDSKAIDLNIRTDQNGVAQVNGLEIFGCTTNRLFYHYRGSATAPPCGETVDWFIYREPLPLKTQNYNAIKKLINQGNPNARATQRINGRKVYLVGDACTLIQK